MPRKSAKTSGVADERAPATPSAMPASPVEPVTNSTDPERVSGAGASRRKRAREKVAGAARATGSFVKSAATFAGDRNRDGKVDQEDARIAAGKAKKIASATAAGAKKLGKEVLKHDMGKDAAAGAAIGALVAAPIPVVGPVAGAAVGAIAGMVKNVRSRKK